MNELKQYKRPVRALDLSVRNQAGCGLIALILTVMTMHAPAVEIEDAYVRGGIYGTNNYGSQAEIRLWSNETIGYRHKAYFKLDAQALAEPGELIQSVKFSITAKGNGPAVPVTLKLFGLVTSAAWDEAGITYNDAPENPPGNQMGPGAVLLQELYVDGGKITSGATFDFCDQHLAEYLNWTLGLISNPTNYIYGSSTSTTATLILTTSSETRLSFDSTETATGTQPGLEVLCEPVSVAPLTDDAYIRGGIYKYDNYGSQKYVSVRYNATIGHVYKAHLQFSPVGDCLQSGEMFARAELRLKAYAAVAADTNSPILQLYGVMTLTNAWNESTITYNNAPANQIGGNGVPGAVLLAELPVGTNAVAVNSTWAFRDPRIADYLNWAAGAGPGPDPVNYPNPAGVNAAAFVVRVTSAWDTGLFAFDSKEATRSGAVPPQLAYAKCAQFSDTNSYPGALIVKVDDYCWGNGVTNDTLNLSYAVDALKALPAASQKVLLFGAGKTYLLNSAKRNSLYQLDLVGLTNVTVEGNNSLLIVTPRQAPIRVSRCENVTVRNLNVENSPHSFSQGMIYNIATNGSYFDVETVDGYPLDLAEQKSWPPADWRWSVVVDPFTRYQREGVYRPLDIVDVVDGLPLPSGHFRVLLEPGEEWKVLQFVKVGDIHVQQLKDNPTGRTNALDIRRNAPNYWILFSSNIVFDRVNTYSARCAGVFSFYNNYGPLTIRGCIVDRSPRCYNQMISGGSNTIHGDNSRVGPLVENNTFRALIDDGINLHSSPFFALAAYSSNCFKLEEYWRDADDCIVQQGDEFMVASPGLGTYTGPYTVASVDPANHIITLLQDVPGVMLLPADGTPDEATTTFYHISSAHPNSIVRGNLFDLHRGGCGLKVLGGLFENNVMLGPTFGVIVGGDFQEALGNTTEGPCGRDIIISNNLITALGPAVQIKSQFPAAQPTRNITIVNNELWSGSSHAVWVDNVEDVLIDNNVVLNAEGAQHPDPYSVTNSVNVTIDP
jgi:hypothetical protein